MDGVVIVCEHGNYPTDLKGHWLLPRWWIYQQVMQVFERSKRSVPVFNDKHLSYNWDDAKWMFDKSRELNFPLTGGSSIPTYFRKPEIDLAPDTPLKNGLVIGGMADEGATCHCIDVFQSFMDRRKGSETGVKSVQSIRGPEAWKWVEANPWANNLLEAVRKNFDFPPGHFQGGGQGAGQQGARPQQARPQQQTNLCIVEYNDGIKAASISGNGVGWTFAGDIAGQKDPTIISMLGWPGPISQYHAANAHERLDHRDDADRKGTVQRGAAASVHRDCEPLHGIKLAERSLLCRRTPHRDAVHEHEISLDPRTALSNRAAAAGYSLYTGLCNGIGSAWAVAEDAFVIGIAWDCLNFFFARCDLHHHDCIADHIGGALLAVGAFRHRAFSSAHRRCPA